MRFIFSEQLSGFAGCSCKFTFMPVNYVVLNKINLNFEEIRLLNGNLHFFAGSKGCCKSKNRSFKIDLALRLKTDKDVHPVLQSLMHYRLELTRIELQIKVLLFERNKQDR